MQRRFFHGWLIVAIAWFVYGFGIAPGYFSWGFLSREMIDELGLTRGEAGFVFGVFTFLYSGSGILVGLALTRWKLRSIMCGGSAACGVRIFHAFSGPIAGGVLDRVLGLWRYRDWHVDDHPLSNARIELVHPVPGAGHRDHHDRGRRRGNDGSAVQ